MSDFVELLHSLGLAMMIVGLALRYWGRESVEDHKS